MWRQIRQKLRFVSKLTLRSDICRRQLHSFMRRHLQSPNNLDRHPTPPHEKKMEGGGGRLMIATDGLAGGRKLSSLDPHCFSLMLVHLRLFVVYFTEMII